MTGALDWQTDGRDWPHREHSRFVRAAGLRWHVQQFGEGPAVLLLHGAGASTHSWRGLAPLLARHHTVVAADLPGHGFTGTPPPRQASLPGMAAALHGLLDALELQPVLAIGHSAGAAVMLRMSIDGRLSAPSLISLNGALLPLRGFAGRLFSPAAKLFAANPLVPRLFAWRAGERTAVERLLASTGSVLDRRGVELYTRLLRNRVHIAGVLSMMANWDLRPLRDDLPCLRAALTLIVGDRDGTVSPQDALRVQALLPGAAYRELHSLGHLAHEEDPAAVYSCIQMLPDKTAEQV